MEKMKQIIFLYIIAFPVLFSSCASKVPTGKDLIGIWKSKDGARFELKSDFSFIATNIPIVYYLLNGEKKYGVNFFSGIGKWKIQNGQTHWEIDITFTTSSVGESRFGNQLLISGGGLLERSKPYKNIFIQVGDPDSNERYEFKKQ